MLKFRRTGGQEARIKEHCVDNAVGLDGQQWCRCARQPEVQSKMDVLGGPTAMTAASRCAGGTSVKSRETDQENGYEN